jgi:hypothetical protein
MITIFAFITLGLIVLTWLYSMYTSWKVTTGAQLTVAQTAPLLAQVDKGVRLSRRGWYTTLAHLKRILIWSESRAQKVFLKVFPKAAPAFAKRDILTGLTHGPSSYFLKSISKTPATKTKRLPHNKNMI